jgi:glycine C-acetyltransferase
MALGLRNVLKTQLEAIAKAGTWKSERILAGAQGSKISVVGRSKQVREPQRCCWVFPRSNRRQVLNFCANNYLGLSNDPTVVASAKKALDTHGNGLSSVRFICGTQDIHKELEATIARVRLLAHVFAFRVHNYDRLAW